MATENQKNAIVGIIITAIIITIVIGVVALPMWVLPRYGLYRLNLKGQATLKEAEWTKKVLVEDAKALKAAAVYKAEAEVERAKGVAQANQIIGESLKGNEGYLRYLWIQGLQDGSSEVIYIPTEAGMPILEAGKR